MALKGHKWSEESRRRFSKKKRGVPMSPKNREALKQYWDSMKGTTRPGFTMRGRKHSEETRLKISRANTGRNIGRFAGNRSHLWRGGLTEKSKQIRNSTEYKNWRRAVFERDGYTCVLCLARNGNGIAVELNADHIKPFYLFPELRLDVSNGRTLCRPCHLKTDTFGNPQASKKHGSAMKNLG